MILMRKVDEMKSKKYRWAKDIFKVQSTCSYIKYILNLGEIVELATFLSICIRILIYHNDNGNDSDNQNCTLTTNKIHRKRVECKIDKACQM